MKLVILETPYASPFLTTRNFYKVYLIRAMRDSISRGEAPFASHMLYAHSEVLDDEIGRERELGMELGQAWGIMAAGCVIYDDLGISPGMKRGIEFAHANRIPVEYRQINSRGLP